MWSFFCIITFHVLVSTLPVVEISEHPSDGQIEMSDHIPEAAQLGCGTSGKPVLVAMAEFLKPHTVGILGSVIFLVEGREAALDPRMLTISLNSTY